MYSVVAKGRLGPPWDVMAPIRIGCVAGSGSGPDDIFLVSADQLPFARVELYCHRDDYHGFESCAIWSHYLVIGAGHRVHFVDLRNASASEFDLGCYFGSLCVDGERLLAASAERVFSFDRHAALQWRSDMLGIDGVVVERITASAIEGVGEWDPPGGWKPFRLSAANGLTLSDPA